MKEGQYNQHLCIGIENGRNLMGEENGLSKLEVTQDTMNQICFSGKGDGRVDAEGQNWEEKLRPARGMAGTRASQISGERLASQNKPYMRNVRHMSVFL